MNFIIITKRKWNNENYKNLKKNIFIFDKINIKKIRKINPKIIFFIHWSKYISSLIYNKYLCIQFHASNLPKGRGGSPIQNQILKNIKKTKISAFKVSKKLDSGPICSQENLSLEGNAFKILNRLEIKCLKIIKKIIKTKNLKFRKQKGVATYFRRRTPLDSEIVFQKIKSSKKLYDFLRMLDAPGYPKAFIKLNKFKLTFDNIKIFKNRIYANVEINQK